MGANGHTLSATRFAALTGVSRERLRTWERRHGFPAPRRVGSGPRRYAVEDVPRVVAVRHAVAEGVPIPEAIARARAVGAAEAPGPAALAALAEHLPTPVVVVSGPAPIRVAWVNGAVRTQPGAPPPGAHLPDAVPGFAGSVAEGALERMFATEAPATEVHHPAWGGHARLNTRSTLFRLPAAEGEPPLVALVGLEGDGERTARAALAALRMEVDDLRRTRARHLGWLEGLAGLGAALAHEPEPAAAVSEALEVVVRDGGAADAALARHADGALRVAGSRRGVIAAADVLVAAHPGLARALRDGEAAWLEPAAAAALEVPAGLRACAVPVAVAGESLGLLVVVMDAVQDLDVEALRPLGAVAAGLGVALLRDRLVGELRRTAAGA
jgi:MerR family transcriptional regulator, light-induced transcriptional regulator